MSVSCENCDDFDYTLQHEDKCTPTDFGMCCLPDELYCECPEGYRLRRKDGVPVRERTT